MPKLTNISGKNAVKGFIKFGYSHVHTSGDHAILQKSWITEFIDTLTQGGGTISFEIPSKEGWNSDR